jgi:hypothetical protein
MYMFSVTKILPATQDTYLVNWYDFGIKCENLFIAAVFVHSILNNQQENKYNFKYFNIKFTLINWHFKEPSHSAM